MSSVNFSTVRTKNEDVASHQLNRVGDLVARIQDFVGECFSREESGEFLLQFPHVQGAYLRATVAYPGPEVAAPARRVYVWTGAGENGALYKEKCVGIYEENGREKGIRLEGELPCTESFAADLIPLNQWIMNQAVSHFDALSPDRGGAPLQKR